MHTKRILKLIICTFFFVHSFAQTKETTVDVDIHSLTLFNTAQWKELVVYGKDKINTGIDFPLLRMRIGYASFMLGNYAQSLVQYKKAYKAEPSNETALYYVYLNNVYLNNTNEARYYASLMTDIARKNLNLKKVKLSGVDVEASYKATDDIYRNDAQYYRLGVNTQLGYRLELQQSGAMYNQVINEPRLPAAVQNKSNIDIQQKEYYAKAIFVVNGKLSLIGGYHYLYTPFNNLVYNNQIGFGGISYKTPFVHFKAIVNFATITDSSYNQYDASISLFPLGNTKVYTISKGSYNSKFIFTQVAGVAVSKNVWLEVNATIGQYNNFVDNDALYVYNDIDQKQFKLGASLYTALSKNLMLSLNYNFDQKLKYKTNNIYFNQHSTTGGLQWKF